ncbi:MAG TPA: hypothetical protein VIS27_06125 [Yeosuana sp.]
MRTTFLSHPIIDAETPLFAIIISVVIILYMAIMAYVIYTSTKRN